MLVFRCECEQVLGVENDASKGEVGQCPACGRIIRVPVSLMNASGKLRLSGTPSRATPSGAFRQIKDSKPDGARSTTFPAVAPASPFPAAKKADDARVAAAKVAAEPTVAAEPETLAPLTDKDTAPPAASDVFPSLPPEADAKPVLAETVYKKDGLGKKSSRVVRLTPETQSADPAAVTETKLDPNLGTAVASASSRRRKETAAATPGKNRALIYILALVLIAAAAAALYALGIIGGETKPAVNENKAKPEETKAAPKPDDKADTEKKDAAPADKAGDVK